MTTSQLRTTLERKKGQREQITKSLSTTTSDITSLKADLILHEQAREVIRTVGMNTQKQLQYHISDIASLALNAVFENPYELKVDFVQRRNKTECDILFVRDGMELDPLTASGVGAVDIASFALRIASWSMQRPHTMNTIILDEPMKCLSAEYHERASQMIKEVSDKLGLQILMISHNETLAASADRTFRVSMKNGRSIVKKV